MASLNGLIWSSQVEGDTKQTICGGSFVHRPVSWMILAWLGSHQRCVPLWSEPAAWPPALIRSSHQPPQNVFIMRPVLVAEAVTSSSTRLPTVAGSRAEKLRLIGFSGTRHLVSFSNCVEVLEKEEVRTSGCEKSDCGALLSYIAAGRIRI